MTAARHRLACLEPIAAAELTDRRRYLLVDCVETYVQLDGAAREEYDALLAERGNEEVATMELTWAGRIAHEARESALKEGIEKGIEKGLEKGLEKGREEGKRDLLLEQLERRFGPLPQATVKRVRALTSSEELSRLATRVLDAPSLEDLGL
jgi:flagellar biosynthesis/type III secretory pathway protein FliH